MKGISRYQFVIHVLVSFVTLHAQPHAQPSDSKPAPRDVVNQLIGHWAGKCTYQNQTKEFVLDVDRLEDKVLSTWSIYQTGFVSQRLGSMSYDSASNQIVLGGFVFLRSNGSKDEYLCKISRHSFSAEFVLKRASEPVRDFTTVDVSFNNGDVKLAGTLYRPKSKSRHSAVVFLHGSGPATRWEWAPFFAEKLANLGIASLIFDKRGCGESSGDWTIASLDDLSGDAIAGLKFLKEIPGIDKSKIGLWGYSNSGWVVSNATNFTNDISFIICVSGGGLTPKAIEQYGYRNILEKNRVSDSDEAEALALVDQYLRYLSDGVGRQSLIEKINLAKNESWYEYINIGKSLPSEQYREKWAWVANWDPLPSIEKIRIPTLVVLGEADQQTYPAGTSDRWKRGLETAGNRNFKVITFPKANHGIRLGEHSPGATLFWQDFAPGYVSLVLKWMKGI